MLQSMNTSHPSLTIIGDLCVDVTMGPISGWPEVGTETIMDEHELRPGGSAANSALATAYIGSDCSLISLFGGDHFGRWLAGCFEDSNNHLASCDAATTMSVCLTHSCSERTIFTTRGHLEEMTLEHALLPLEPAKNPGDTVLLTGVYLLPGLRQDYETLLMRIREAGYEIAIDTGWPTGGWCDDTRAEALAWLPHCSHLLVNESEALGLADTKDLAAAAEMIRMHMPEKSRLVVKRGSRGAAGVNEKGTIQVSTEPVQVRDSIGAGDTFNAGYLDAWLRGADLGSALEAGCILASTVIGRSPRGEIQAGELSKLAFTGPEQ